MAHLGTILVVEDSDPGREILSKFIHEMGFKTLQASDGKAALGILHSGAKAGEVVCVLADLRMPNLDGIEMLRTLRLNAEYSQYKNIPVVFVTASSDQQNVTEAKNLRVSGYVLKPVTYERLSQKLQEIFPEKKIRI